MDGKPDMSASTEAGSTSKGVEPVPPPARRSAIRRLFLRPEAGGVVSAILVFLFFAILVRGQLQK